VSRARMCRSMVQYDSRLKPGLSAENGEAAEAIITFHHCVPCALYGEQSPVRDTAIFKVNNLGSPRGNPTSYGQCCDACQ
jgi:hypothetical protein